MRVNVKSGAYACTDCGASGGDVLAYHMALHGGDEVLAANAEQVEQYRASDEAKRGKMFGFFVGQAMKASKGKANPQQAKRITDMLAATSPEGYAANCAAVRDADFRDQLGSIKVPLLVIAGTEDAVTPPSGGHFIQEHVAGAEYAEFQAAHLSNVEVGEPFSRRVIDFLLAR